MQSLTTKPNKEKNYINRLEQEEKNLSSFDFTYQVAVLES
jgi:hypothetical protein